MPDAVTFTTPRSNTGGPDSRTPIESAGAAPPCPAGATITTPCVTPKYWTWPEWNTDSYYFNSSTALGAASSTQLRAFYVRYANGMDMFDDASYATMNLNASSGRTRNRDRTVGVSGEFDSRARAAPRSFS